MSYVTPELISIGSATNLVLANESSPNPCLFDNSQLTSKVDELW